MLQTLLNSDTVHALAELSHTNTTHGGAVARANVVNAVTLLP
jgi:hypothetical protein